MIKRGRFGRSALNKASPNRQDSFSLYPATHNRRRTHINGLGSNWRIFLIAFVTFISQRRKYASASKTKLKEPAMVVASILEILTANYNTKIAQKKEKKFFDARDPL